jgi:signal transduction histidine kinase/ActR/RegA family two-component response regulator
MAQNVERDLRSQTVLTGVGVLLIAISSRFLDITASRIDDPLRAWPIISLVTGLLLMWLVVRTGHTRLRRERALRFDAQHAASHGERLSELTAALGRARSETAVLEAAVQEPLHALRADAAMFLAVSEDGQSATVMRAVAYDAVTSVAEQTEVRLDGALKDAVQRRIPVFVESRTGNGTERADIVPPSYAAHAAVPLVMGGKATAIVRLDFRSARHFTDDDKEFLNVLSRHTSQILERTRQFESAQRARTEAEGLRARADQELVHRQKTEQALRSSETRYRALATRTTRLHGLTAALSEAVTVDAVANAVVRQGNVVVGATSGSVLLLVDNGSAFAVLHAESYGRVLTEVGPFPAEPGLCESDAVTGGEPVFVASWEEAHDRHWRSAPAAADAAYVSSAVLPLVVDGGPLGVLRFDFSVPVNFDAEYQALLVSVAQHCTQALDRARLYDEAQKARAAAEGANRHKDEFLSIVSHELRTPLNAVMGWAAILRKGTSDSTLMSRAVQSIHDNATRQAKLIDDLLDVSRIVAGRATLDKQEIDLSELIGGVVESFIPVAAEAKVELHLPAVPHALVRGDARRLEQVFFNLLANALKFTGKEGRIDVDASIVADMIEVRVRDTGIGIEPAFLPYVFEPFRQADSGTTRNYGGLGLGLSIAKQLVEAHKGSMSVKSEGIGHGSTFGVRLPIVRVVAAPRQEQVHESGEQAEPPRLDGIRVLGVDDEQAARDIMEYTLAERGAAVTMVCTSAEAFDLLWQKEFDVLLADIAMPQEDGCALLRRIRACSDSRVASIPAAAVTAHARDDERRAVLAAGFQLHLVKPIDPADLARAVDRLARREAVPAGTP